MNHDSFDSSSAQAVLRRKIPAAGKLVRDGRKIIKPGMHTKEVIARFEANGRR